MAEPSIGLKNYMEDCVAELLTDVLDRMDVCKCERCRLDILAQVLNKMPPKYVVTHKGQLYTKLSGLHSQWNVDILTAITTAASIVNQRPRHDD